MAASPSPAAEETSPLFVIKVGGSLLQRADLGKQYRTWRATLPPARDLIVVGGGLLVDAVRRYDAIHALPEDCAHWSAIDAMRITARLFTATVPEAQRVEHFASALAAGTPQAWTFDVADFLQRHEPQAAGAPLPLGWRITSDSIAARVAEIVGAERLVLLKSVDVDTSDLAELARRGVVDEYFPQAAAGLPRVELHHLRDMETRA